jgi:hypothetical protein
MVPTQILCIMSDMHCYIMHYENFDCSVKMGDASVIHAL